MKKAYQAPVLEEVGGVAALTAALGTSTRVDFSEFPALPSSTGSFDACDSDPTNNPGGDFCVD
ncbi:MAG: lasso peptide [Bacteroidota bacterium]